MKLGQLIKYNKRNLKKYMQEMRQGRLVPDGPCE